MRANLSDELFKAIDEKIYIDLEIHILNKKLIKAEEDKKEGFVKHLNQIITRLSQQRRSVNDYLRQNGIKVQEAVNFYDIQGQDSIFVDYYYSQKVDGGYKEGTMRYWKDAMKLKLKNRMKDYFTVK
ncbi:hypothetical protein [Microcystis phage MaeS]|nr:hypothetical protein [Microcystis phage MaeS]